MKQARQSLQSSTCPLEGHTWHSAARPNINLWFDTPTLSFSRCEISVSDIHHPLKLMDTLLHSPLSMAKRPCPSQNPRIQNLNHVDHLLEAFLRLSEFPSLSTDLSLERLLDSSPSDADETLLIDRALKMGSMLLDATKQFLFKIQDRISMPKIEACNFGTIWHLNSFLL